MSLFNAARADTSQVQGPTNGYVLISAIYYLTAFNLRLFKKGLAGMQRQNILCLKGLTLLSVIGATSRGAG